MSGQALRNFIIEGVTAYPAIKPNKLRKIVCKKCAGATWDDFKTTLEVLREEGAITEHESPAGEKVLSLSNAQTEKPNQPADGSESNTRSDLVKKTVVIHNDLVEHLRKHKKKKWKNIELNTKTTLRVETKTKDTFSLVSHAFYHLLFAIANPAYHYVDH
jgi:hypothetical protein